MSIKKGLIGFGMSAALMAGGAASLHEWHSDWEKIHKAEACANIDNIGNVACANQIIVTKDEVDAMRGDAIPYSALGGTALAVGGIAAVWSIIETMGSDFEFSFTTPEEITPENE